MRLQSSLILSAKKVKFALRNPVRFCKIARVSSDLYRVVPALRFDSRTAAILGKSFPKRDWFLSHRQPQISSLSKPGEPLLQSGEMYREEDEVRMNVKPYSDFATVIARSGALEGVQTVLDIGCSTGHLISELRRIAPHLEVSGIELFEYQRLAADSNVRDEIHIFDVREPLPSDLSADLVICTEVGEHIEPQRLSVFLGNLRAVTAKRLVLTWSEAYGPPMAPPQHLSPLSREDVFVLMTAWGFTLRTDLTREVVRGLKKSNEAYSWWLDSLSVWEATLR